VDEIPDVNPSDDGIFRPTVANTYPRYMTYNSDPAKNKRTQWWGWAFLPSQRAPTLQDLVSDNTPARPLIKKDSMWFGEFRDRLAMITRHRELIRLVASFTWDEELASEDPAPNIKLTSVTDLYQEESRWLCASKDADKYNRAFTFVGDPVDGAHTADATAVDIATPDTVDPDEYRFSMYRGIYGEWVHPDIDTSGSTAEISDAEEGPNGSGVVDVKNATAPVFKAIRPFWTKTMDWADLKEDEPDDQDPKLYAIHPEGMVLGKFSTASFKRKEEYYGLKSSWATTPVDKAKTLNCVFPYALRWESAHKQGLFKFFLRSFAAAISMFLPGNFALGSVAGFFGRAIVLGGEKYLGMSQDGENFTIDKQGALQLKSYFPPGYRPLNRLAVRRYRRLESLIPEERNTVPLKLDGVLWCDDLNTERGFKYFGRGMVVSSGLNPQAGAEDKQTLKCPILPQLTLTEGDVDGTQLDLKTLWNDDPDAKAGDGTVIEVNPHYLTIAMTRPDSNNDYKGNRALVFKTDEDQPKSGYVAASIVAEHGITAKASNNIHIVGNYVCRLVNKQKIPGDGDNPTDQSNIYVSYDQRFYPERWKVEDDGSFAEASGGGREELEGESEIKAVPSVSPQFNSSKFYSFNFSRKLCGVRFGLSRQGNR
jgi:hypothetical protein